MLAHHVFFWLKNPDSKEDKEKLQQGLQSLRGIESIRTIHIGTPSSTDRPVIDRSYDFSLITFFDNMEGHDVYQVHPAHKKFIEENSSLWSKVVIYDSEDV